MPSDPERPLQEDVDIVPTNVPSQESFLNSHFISFHDPDVRRILIDFGYSEFSMSNLLTFGSVISFLTEATEKKTDILRRLLEHFSNDHDKNISSIVNTSTYLPISYRGNSENTHKGSPRNIMFHGSVVVGAEVFNRDIFELKEMDLCMEILDVDLKTGDFFGKVETFISKGYGILLNVRIHVDDFGDEGIPHMIAIIASVVDEEGNFYIAFDPYLESIRRLSKKELISLLRGELNLYEEEDLRVEAFGKGLLIKRIKN